MRNKTAIRQKRNRAKLKRVNTDKPRLTVFRSAKNIYAQLIDDSKRTTIASASSKEKSIEKIIKQNYLKL
jgi:Ribosomal protein L18